MAEYRPVAVSFANHGLNIRTVDDEVRVDEYVKFSNLVSNREGSISTRKGRLLLNQTAIAADVHTLAKLPPSPLGFRYAGANTFLYRAQQPYNAYVQIIPGTAWLSNRYYKVGDLIRPTISDGHFYRCTQAGVSGGTEPTFDTKVGANTTDNDITWTESNLSGDPMLAEPYAVGLDTKPWMFFTDLNAFIKDNGLRSPQLAGIVPPDIAASATATANTTSSIEGFESATPGSYWTVSDPGTILTLSQETTIKKVGTASLKAVFSGSGTASITRNSTLDLSTINDDLIHMYIQASDMSKVDSIVWQFSLGDTTFHEMYEKTIVTDQSLVDAANNPTGPTFIEEASNIWIQMDIAKSYFKTFLSAGSSSSWATVKAIRMTVTTNGATNMYFDDWSVLGGGVLLATDYEWKYIYRESSTGTKSNPSPAMADTLTLNQTTGNVTVRYSRAANVDKIDIYRLGGTVASDYRLSGTIDNDPTAVADSIVYVDTVADAFLTDSLETDNDRPPNFAGIELHNETLFGWGAVDDPPNLVRFSKRVFVEQWPSAYQFYVGSGAEKVVRLIRQGQQIFAVTLAQVYAIIGTDPTSYQAISTGFNRGMIDSRFAACRMPGGFAMVSFDGIYEFPSGRKLSEAIDGIFHGEIINGITPMNREEISRVRLEFFDNRLYLMYRRTTPQAQATTLTDTGNQNPLTLQIAETMA